MPNNSTKGVAERNLTKYEGMILFILCPIIIVIGILSGLFLGESLISMLVGGAIATGIGIVIVDKKLINNKETKI